jgi:hypothetical protein
VIVVCELSGWQELILVVLFVAHEETDKLLKLLIDVLHLALSLQVVGSGGCRLYTDEAPQLPGKIRNKLRASVGNVLLGYSVAPPDIKETGTIWYHDGIE